MRIDRGDRRLQGDRHLALLGADEEGREGRNENERCVPERAQHESLLGGFRSPMSLSRDRVMIP